MKFKIRFTLNHTRMRGILSGYRPTWTCNSKPDHNSGAMYWSGKEWIEKGETYNTLLWPLQSKYWEEVRVNDVLKCMEGSKIVGEAIVLEILPDVPMV